MCKGEGGGWWGGWEGQCSEAGDASFTGKVLIKVDQFSVLAYCTVTFDINYDSIATKKKVEQVQLLPNFIFF